MRIEECIKCGAIVDATDAPPGVKIYCSDCAPKTPIPIEKPIKEEKRIRAMPERVTRIPGVPSYKHLEILPEGRWVTVSEATKILNLHFNTVPLRVKAGRYKLAYVGNILYLDMKSYEKKKYERRTIKDIKVIQGKCICAVEDGMRFRQCNARALYKWDGKQEFCMKHFSQLKKGKTVKTIYDLENRR